MSEVQTGLPSSDEALLAAYADRADEPAFAAIVARHGPMVYRVCVRVLWDHHEAEDAAQAVFAILVRKARSVRKGQSLGSWLHGTARNVALHMLRGRRRSREHEREFMMDASQADPGMEEGLRHEVLALLDRGIAGLSAVQREAVTLRYLENHSAEAAAAIAGCSLAAINNRAFDGVAKLRKLLAGRGLAVTVAALAGVLSAESEAAVPPGLIPAMMTMPQVAAPGAAASANPILKLAEGAMKMMFWKQVGMAAGIGGMTLAGIAGIALAGNLVSGLPVAASAVGAAGASGVYSWPEYLYDDQMESGDLAKVRRVIAEGGGTAELEMEIRHSGRYAAKVKVPASGDKRQAYLQYQFSEHPRWPVSGPVYAQTYFRLGDDFATGKGETVSVLAFGSFKPAPDGAYKGHLAEVALRGNGKGFVLCVPGDGGAAGKTALSAGKWYGIEAKLAPGDAGAQLTVSLDGKEEFTANVPKLPETPGGVCVGILSAKPGAGGSMIVDDFAAHDRPIGPQAVGIRLAHPNFSVRIGAPVVAILSGDQPGDALVVSLTSKNGLKREVLNRKGPLNGRVEFQVDLRNLPASTYSLAARLLDGNGKERARAEYSYVKAFNGDPQYSIDEDNAITRDGKKFFPVTSFGLKRTLIAEWKEKRYCNILYGKEWGTELVGIPKYKRLLDVAAENGMQVIGPSADDRFDRQGLPQWTPEAIREYLTELRDHPGVAWWMWREEPINWKYHAKSVKLWWDLVRELNPNRMHEVLHMGNCYQIGLLKSKLVFQVWPYLCGDVYSWDIYPIENEHEKHGSFVEYAEVAERAVNWNMNLVPVIVNVATADCTPGKKGGTPTPDEIAFVNWLSIVHQAKGVHWYPYQGKVPPENYEYMTKFVDQVTELTEAILGKPAPQKLSKKELGGGRVDARATTDGKDTWIFAVNLQRKEERVTFALDPWPRGCRIEVYGEDRVLPLADDGFTDSFGPIGVRIYRVTGGK